VDKYKGNPDVIPVKCHVRDQITFLHAALRTLGGLIESHIAIIAAEASEDVIPLLGRECGVREKNSEFEAHGSHRIATFPMLDIDYPGFPG